MWTNQTVNKMIQIFLWMLSKPWERRKWHFKYFVKIFSLVGFRRFDLAISKQHEWKGDVAGKTLAKQNWESVGNTAVPWLQEAPVPRSNTRKFSVSHFLLNHSKETSVWHNPSNRNQNAAWPHIASKKGRANSKYALIKIRSSSHRKFTVFNLKLIIARYKLWRCTLPWGGVKTSKMVSGIKGSVNS